MAGLEGADGEMRGSNACQATLKGDLAKQLRNADQLSTKFNYRRFRSGAINRAYY